MREMTKEIEERLLFLALKSFADADISTPNVEEIKNLQEMLKQAYLNGTYNLEE